MLIQLVQRLLRVCAVLFAVTALTFILLTAAGGDALSELRDDPQVSDVSINRLRQVYGLDQPVGVRYVRWLTSAVRGDLGESFYYHTPVSTLLIPRTINSLLLITLAMLWASLLAVIIGGWAARRSGSLADRACDLLILLLAATPRIVLALVALAILSSTILLSALAEIDSQGPLRKLIGALVPALVLSVPLLAILLAQVRAGLKAALKQDFVLVARAKGLRERAVVFRHALRAALSPALTVLGYSFGGLLSGSVIVENILGWPGLGSILIVAVRSRDVPLLLGIVLVASAGVLLGNALAATLQVLNDPRMREGDARLSSAAAEVSANTT